MDDSQRDLAEETTAQQALRSTRRTGRYTLLLVGDHGRVITFRGFWPIIIGAVSLLVLAAAVSGAVGFLYFHTRTVNLRLQNSLHKVQQQIINLRSEKEILMARLVVAETESQNLQARLPPKPAPKRPNPSPEAPEAVSLSSEGHPLPQPETATSVADADPAAPKAQAEPADREKERQVAVEDFKVLHEPASNTFRVQFVLRKNSPGAGPVAGYTVVVLKTQDAQTDQWLTIPTVKLADGFPAGSKQGQYFSISNFKPMKFSVTSEMDPRMFESATVFVFDVEGTLLLEEDIVLAIQ